MTKMLMKKSSKELKQIAKTLKVKNWWNLTKEELAKGIMESGYEYTDDGQYELQKNPTKLDVDNESYPQIVLEPEDVKCHFIDNKYGSAWLVVNFGKVIAEKSGCEFLVLAGHKKVFYGAESAVNNAVILFNKFYAHMENSGYKAYRKALSENKGTDVDKSFYAGYIEAINTYLKDVDKIPTKEVPDLKLSNCNYNKQFTMNADYHKMGYNKAVERFHS